MSQAQAIWLLIGLALVMANLPWLSDRFLFVIQPKSGVKTTWMRLIEWCILFLITGFIALGLEKKYFGETHQQSWEFYVVSFCLFLVFAIPGFIYRHQIKKIINKKS